MRELADLVIQKVESSAGTTLAPLPSDDPRQRQPDITLARKVLGWEPRVALSATVWTRRSITFAS